MGEFVPIRFKPKRKSRQYQAQALRDIFRNHGRWGLFLKPGTGKTKIAIDFCCAAFLQRKAQTVLIVCQKTGHPVWEDELRKDCSVPYRLIVLTGGSKKAIEALNTLEPGGTRLTFILVNYELTWRIEAALVSLDADVLVCDEAHKIKNRSAKQSRCIHRLVQALDPYRLLLTGTPIANAPLDIFSQYLAIDDSVFGRRWAPFANSYAIFYGYYNRQVRYKNLGDLRRRARQRATVLTKEECLDLPGSLPQVLYTTMSEATRKAYDEMEEYFITYLGENDSASAAIKLTQLLRLSQITGGYVTTEEHEEKQVGSEKLDKLEDTLDGLMNANEKAVVFARFRWEVNAIEALCLKNRWRSYKYYGPVKGERLHYPVKFTQHKGPAVFIAQTATGALSIDLTAAAYGVFYSFDYSLINWEQCHDRLDRGGQTRKVTFYYLVMRGTKDAEILQALRTKKGVASILENKPSIPVI